MAEKVEPIKVKCEACGNKAILTPRLLHYGKCPICGIYIYPPDDPYKGD